MKLSNTGTLPLFITLLSLIGLLVISIFYFHYQWVSTFKVGWLSIPLSVTFTNLTCILILNIPIPRKKVDPTHDLQAANKLAEGAWCSVYQKVGEPSRVVKQLYFCGWGHNDYSKHRAFVLGREKVCGAWTPLVLWFIHNYMLFYQILGLKRRMKLEGRITALPKTYALKPFQLRYEQEYVPYALTPETCPADIIEQFQQLNAELKACGVYIDDVHARNVRITEDGKIKLVDGELYTDAEESVKSQLVVLFNGEMVAGMNKVLDNERIIVWKDHRMTVDQIWATTKQTIERRTHLSCLI